ncbi:COG1470 family protein [Streptomyces himalayensis]|uniref:DUF916 domain-containing protein n=1 Tax=Streptomyces himalayensis subsp. himalayensis TaxID=2756131 RepID=A0A7W0DRI5_9ACTN|nr:hypothetical protein [Streptomyces himalayensis]MBA2949912.1 hypothetical protein [Streptomyces himalayensis subsp. himalayensis]
MPLVLLLVVAAAAPVRPAHNGILAAAYSSTAWSVVPSAGGGTRPAKGGRPYFYAEGVPGAVLEDTVSVVNPGAKALTVELRGADADNTRGGGLSLRKRSTDTGAWITFAERKLRIPPHTRADVPFTVTVPEDATPGDHPGAIVASGGGRDAAVRLQLRVSGPTLAALTVERVRAEGRHISYDLVNRGNTVLTPRLTVRADGVFGEVLHRGPRTLPVELLPGRRITLTEPWPDAPTFDAVDISLTATAAGGARDTAAGSARFVPWGLLAGVAAGLAAAGGGAFWWRRRVGGLRGRSARGPDVRTQQMDPDNELTGAVT